MPSHDRAPSARQTAKIPTKADMVASVNQQPPAGNQPASSREKARASGVANPTSTATSTTGNLNVSNSSRRRSSNEKSGASAAAGVVASNAATSSDMVGTAENVRVVVRCRPLNDHEKQNGNQIVVSIDKLNNMVIVLNPTAAPTTAQNIKQQPQQAQQPKQFTFDTVFDIGTTQLDVYNEAARPVVEVSCLRALVVAKHKMIQWKSA